MIQRLFVKAKNLTQVLKYNFVDEWGEHFIRPYNIKTPEKYKNVYKDNKQLTPYPRIRASFYDALYMPGLDEERLYHMQRQILLKGQVVLSNQFIALLLYHLSKKRMMIQETMEIIQQWIPRHKGQYTARQIFGCIYGGIIYNRMSYVNFFLDQIKASNLQFQISEAVEIIEALNQNKEMTVQEKHKFWQDNFKKAFVDNMYQLISGRVSTVLRIFDAFKDFEYYDEQIWDRIITMMDNKSGWIRTSIIERLYPLTGTFDKAKLLFDKYYAKLSTNRNVQWRYNLEELRLYTSEQMIAKSQQNINMHPTFRTMLPRDKLESITHRYEQWLVNGAVKEQEEIIRDKSASFGYAIKDRFETLTKDNVDFSKMTKKQFQQLFGQYDEASMKEKQQTQGDKERPQGGQQEQA